MSVRFFLDVELKKQDSTSNVSLMTSWEQVGVLDWIKREKKKRCNLISSILLSLLSDCVHCDCQPCGLPTMLSLMTDCIPSNCKLKVVPLLRLFARYLVTATSKVTNAVALGTVMSLWDSHLICMCNSGEKGQRSHSHIWDPSATEMLYFFKWPCS